MATETLPLLSPKRAKVALQVQFDEIVKDIHSHQADMRRLYVEMCNVRVQYAETKALIDENTSKEDKAKLDCKLKDLDKHEKMLQITSQACMAMLVDVFKSRNLLLPEIEDADTDCEGD